WFVRGSAAEARARAPRDRGPGTAHPRHDARCDLAAARAPRARARRLTPPGTPSMRKSAAFLLPLALAACHASTPAADPARPYAVVEWPLPAMAGSAQPDLATTPDGRLMLAWISRVEGRRNALQFVAMGDNG